MKRPVTFLAGEERRVDVFGFRDQLIESYLSYVKSFINIADDHISKTVQEGFESGVLTPEPLLQLNPAFEPGESIDQLVEAGLLHPECRRIVRIKSAPGDKGAPLLPHRHQVDAFRAAAAGDNYVLTTGTGSGKSLAYIVPIVDYVLRHGSGGGIKAIVVYPMNALANSQLGELEKFLMFGYPDGKPPVTFARYTGQEDEERRREIQSNPPDILLTNYVMLELITTRPDDRPLINAAQGLRFLVLDELHTYRGRQGADVAMLVRRVRDLLNAQDLQCVGTSATLAGPGTIAEQQAEVARMASLLFGAPVRPERVIGETLRRTTEPYDFGEPAPREELRQRVEAAARQPTLDASAFRSDPLASWIESTFGVTRDEESGRLIRSTPRSIGGDEGAAKELSELTGLDKATCTAAIQRTLLAGYEAETADGKPLFAFRLHQFLSPGDTVYASLEPEDKRYVTLTGQQYVPGDRNRVLLPLVFCRECGQEYYSVERIRDRDGKVAFISRDYLDSYDGDSDADAGYLYLSTRKPWTSIDAAIEEGRIPEGWLEEYNGDLRVTRSMRSNLPEPALVRPDGAQVMDGDRLDAQFIHAPFRFCLSCGIEYAGTQRSDFQKLTSLGTEGRSTATTILTLAAIRQLQEQETLPPTARKLLSFTDNRQDASLQAGHLNDFVEIGLLRGALYKAAVAAGPDGIHPDELTQRVFDALNLAPEQYAVNPAAQFGAKADTQRALRQVLGYRLYRDLKRGWRVTLPNLEQCGLLEIRYESLDELAAADQYWQDKHPALVTAAPATRARISRTLLDFMRRELAIKVDYLDALTQERIRSASNQHLIPPWALDENERLDTAYVLKPRRRRRGDSRELIYTSGYSGYARFLRRSTTFPDHGKRLSIEETEQIIRELLETLTVASLVEPVLPPEDEGDVPGYQVPAARMRWVAGDGTRAFHDPIRVPTEAATGHQTNAYFVDFYKHRALDNIGIEAREHTAQVPYEERLDREERFREGRLPILFCSPTMELGVDISQLNVVNMRNVPPTPANYAQRSGRAGRSGQPALVFNYCSPGSPHDQYFFRRPYLMVAGSVTPPRLDLTNHDLILSHIHAIWLSETGQTLGRTLADVLDVEGDPPSLALKEAVRLGLENPAAASRARERAERILATLGDALKGSDWHHENWLDDVFRDILWRFDQAAERWRGLYRAARSQAENQSKIILDATRSHKEKEVAQRLRREAEAQLRLLTSTDSIMQSDFYSYRYFASEGFLPGYSFPRLPLSAYIPGRRMRGRERDEFVQRPRFLAISEFGPRAIIYHEGSRYEINQVILPIGDDEDVLTTELKQCKACGYIHPVRNGVGVDLCERCGEQLHAPWRQLFRLENVSTRRRDRISSDEEERLRLGYEIRTGIRFAVRQGKPSFRSAVVIDAHGEPCADLTYGDTATLWRINLGWRRRKNKEETGFVLDIERGYWARRNETAINDADADPQSTRTRRVIPYVDDRRNSLIFKPRTKLTLEQMTSLQAALKAAIQARYQLEDNEIAAEPLPDRDTRNELLFYESAEGGAGVLQRLLDAPHALAEVAAEALEICHFAPDGTDLKRGPTMREDCEAACYDCLMTYQNQRDHALLDRQAIREVLLQLASAVVDASAGPLPPGEHFERLLRLCESELEKQWLHFIRDNGHHMPNSAQKVIEAAGTRPDFVYEGDYRAAIYVDGPFHALPERKARDQAVADALEDLGYDVIRFGWDEDWSETVKKHPGIFGEGR